MKILALSGSLRARSINTAVLKAAQKLAPPEHEVLLFQGLGKLPLFNPDLSENLPLAVEQLHRQVEQADAIIIASPEYAHGVTGTIKNTLDWLVSFTPFCNLPVAIFNAASRAHHADAALRETLTVMSAQLIERACVTIPELSPAMFASAFANSAAHATVDGACNSFYLLASDAICQNSVSANAILEAINALVLATKENQNVCTD